MVASFLDCFLKGVLVFGFWEGLVIGGRDYWVNYSDFTDMPPYINNGLNDGLHDGLFEGGTDIK